jgi:hypothetical protein
MSKPGIFAILMKLSRVSSGQKHRTIEQKIEHQTKKYGFETQPIRAEASRA